MTVKTAMEGAVREDRNDLLKETHRDSLSITKWGAHNRIIESMRCDDPTEWERNEQVDDFIIPFREQSRHS